MMVKEMTRVYTTEGGIEFYLFNLMAGVSISISEEKIDERGAK